MADADRLPGLALAAVRGAEHTDGVGVAHSCKAAPELRTDPAVIRILHHGAELAVLDQSRAFAAELELVARIVDRPRRVRLHHDAALDARNELVERRVAGLEIEVRHAVDRRAVPAVGARVRDARQPRPLL